MWARLSIVALLALSPFQTTVPVPFGWTDHPSHATATWEVERNGQVVPCGSVTVVGSERRCTAQLPLGAGTFRLRGTRIIDGKPEIGAWSQPLTDTVAAPGPFTVTFHKEGPRVAVASDAISDPGTTFTGDTNWTHTPVGTPRGVWVIIVNVTVSGTDEITGVTYGGVAMAEVAAISPRYKSSGEAMGQSIFFLGSGIPTGPQTIAVDTSGATVTKAAFARTVTAAADTEIIDTAFWSSDSLANPSDTLNLGGRSAYCILAFSSGQNAVTGITPLTNWTATYETDLGNFVAGGYTYDIVGTSNVTVGWTQTAEDALGFAIAVAEVVPPSAGNRRRRLLMGAR